MNAEKHHYVEALAPAADRFTGTVNTDYLSLENYESIVFGVHKGAGATGTSTITAVQASDASGTGAAAMPFRYRKVTDVTASDVPGAWTDATAAGFTTDAAAGQLYQIEIQDTQLDTGNKFVKLTAVEVVDSPVAGSIFAVLHGARYAGAEPKSAIA